MLHDEPGLAVRRAFLPDPEWLPATTAERAALPLLCLDDGTPAAAADALCFSLAYEPELLGLLRCLEMAGVPLLRRDRTARDPLIVVGGPITNSNPLPLVPIADVIALGEGEVLVGPLAAALRAGGGREAARAALRGQPHFLVPGDGDEHPAALPALATADDDRLPAAGPIVTPHSALAGMALVEAARGCSRGCTFCVMGRWTGGGMRAAPVERILAAVPAHAHRVGLVGAAVSDHPRIDDVVAALVESGREVGLSSLRADRLDDRFVALLKAGGYRTMTVAADAPSEVLRARMEKRIKETHLLAAAALAARHGMTRMKVYTIVGLPGETDADLEELARLTGQLAHHVPIAVTASLFVPKYNTPMAAAPFCGRAEGRARLARLKTLLARAGRGNGRRHAVDLRPVSPREAWLEYRISQGGPAVGHAAVAAYHAGGSTGAWERALAATPGCEPLWSRADTPDAAWAYRPGGRRDFPYRAGIEFPPAITSARSFAAHS
jgi:hypothetical protein